METKIKVRNVYIIPQNRKDYKYIIVRDVRDNNDEIEYWFYDFTNDLYGASMRLREIGNGIILELNQVTDECGN